jgi:hypothetical protein
MLCGWKPRVGKNRFFDLAMDGREFQFSVGTEVSRTRRENHGRIKGCASRAAHHGLRITD